MKDGKNNYAELIALQGIQEMLLQNYRNIFLSSQSLLLAVAVFIASRPQAGYFSLFLLAAGIPLCLAWILTDRSRGLSAHFFECQLLKMEQGIEVSKVYNTWLGWTNLELKARKENLEATDVCKPLTKIPKDWKSTRRVMGTILPVIFMLLWVIMALYVLFTQLL